MELQTKVRVGKSVWQIAPSDQLLFVGSCFAANIGQHFSDQQFRTVVNPFGVMYNPVSILHTLQQMFSREETVADPPSSSDALCFPVPDVVVLTLGTNHVYILKETGEVVDNCQKRPQRLFDERELTVEECAASLDEAISLLKRLRPTVRIILTVSPIRYAKYGFHGSQLSKATLLLACHHVVKEHVQDNYPLAYFPAYEIMNDELRDYRFYAADMIHPSDQAVEYIWQCFADTFFSKDTFHFIEEYRPIRQALQHKPFHPDSEEYHQFLMQAQQRLQSFRKKYGLDPD